MVGENAPPLDGWQVIPRHCGEICFDRECPICGLDVVRHPQVPPQVALSDEVELADN